MWRDIGGEAVAAMLARPLRTALTVVGTSVGIAALVAVAGLATTAGAQIVSRFDELAATTITVTPAERDTPQAVQNLIPWDAPQRLARLNGVVAAGTLSTLEVGHQRIRSTTVIDPLAPDAIDAPVVAASPSLYRAVRGQLASGRWFDTGHDQRADPVAVLGRNVARELHLADLRQRPAIFIAGRPYTVIGVLTTVERSDSLLNAVIIPNGVARSLYGLVGPASVVIETRIGAAKLIADQAPTALAPQQPDALIADRPAEPAATRAKVSADVQILVLIIGAVSLTIGGVGIANTTLVTVLERTVEIGLRRSLGGTRASIAGLFVLESALIGLLGATFGACIGVIIVVGVSAVQQWTPVLAGWLPPAAVGIGALIGVLAGLYPAWRASRVEPIAALRLQT
jgi:ABC-type antimicrobial peptide transport system permease subunit